MILKACFLSKKTIQELLKIATPLFFANLTIPLLGFVDSFVVGQSNIASDLGAVGLGTNLINFIFLLVNFLRLSTIAKVSQAKGANKDLTNLLLGNLVFAFFIGLLIILLKDFALVFYQKLINTTDKIERLMNVYFSIRIFASPFNLMLVVISAYFLALQKVKVSVFLLVFLNLTNIIFDIVFVLGLQKGVFGAALASFFAEIITCIFALYLVLKEPIFKNFTSPFKKISQINMIKFKTIFKENFAPLLKLNIYFVLRSFFLQISFIILAVKGNKLGENYLVAHIIFLNFLFFTSYCLDSVASSTEVLFGYEFGAKNKNQMKKVVKESFKFGLYFALSLSFLFILFAKNIVFFTTEITQVREIIQGNILILYILPVCSFLAYILDGVFAGAAKSKDMFFSVFISCFIFFILTYIYQNLSFTSLWCLFLATLILRAFFLGLRLKQKFTIFSS